jgi:hypothetical protein
MVIHGPVCVTKIRPCQVREYFLRLGLEYEHHSPDTVCGSESGRAEGEELGDSLHKSHDRTCMIGVSALLMIDARVVHYSEVMNLETWRIWEQ